VLLAAYLYGSLPVVYLLGAQRDVDLRRRGSGNVGGSNLWAAAGAVRGLAGWVGDASKGLVPILVARRLGCREEVAQFAGVCGVAGQCWPLFLRFNGGRGISAFVGAAYAIDRTAWVAALLPMIGGSLWRVAGLASRQRDLGTQIKATRSKAVPLGCFLGVAGFPVVYGLRGDVDRTPSPAPALLSLLLLLRRLTAPLPDDAVKGPSVRPRALLYRLLYDRNTSR
jgi:glycerol-3-phosphate acyltransferase PlsY